MFYLFSAFSLIRPRVAENLTSLAELPITSSKETISNEKT